MSPNDPKQTFEIPTNDVLPQGVFDIENNGPKTDVTMIAASAALVANVSIHLTITGLIASAAIETRGKNGLSQKMEISPSQWIRSCRCPVKQKVFSSSALSCCAASCFSGSPHFAAIIHFHVANSNCAVPSG